MMRDARSLDADLDALVLELLAPRSRKKGASRPNGHGESAEADAFTVALGRALAEASPLDKALFAESLAPAVADVLAPALADALTPALADALTPAVASALGSLFAPKKSPQEKSAQEKSAQEKSAQEKSAQEKSAQEKPPQDADSDESARRHDRK
jgi:hypothetical protein